MLKTAEWSRVFGLVRLVRLEWLLCPCTIPDPVNPACLLFLLVFDTLTMLYTMGNIFTTETTIASPCKVSRSLGSSVVRTA